MFIGFSLWVCTNTRTFNASFLGFCFSDLYTSSPQFWNAQNAPMTPPPPRTTIPLCIGTCYWLPVVTGWRKFCLRIPRSQTGFLFQCARQEGFKCIIAIIICFPCTHAGKVTRRKTAVANDDDDDDCASRLHVSFYSFSSSSPLSQDTAFYFSLET